MIIFNIYQVIGNAIAWFVIAPSLDILIYAEPANKVYVQGAVAGIKYDYCGSIRNDFNCTICKKQS